MPRDSRSRSPHRHHHSDHHRRSHKWLRHDDKTNNDDSSNHNRVLPFSSGPLGKHDLHRYRPLFALYLDIQKQIDIEDLHDREVKGRWKSFVGKWNHGDLAEGWYDPGVLERAVKSRQEEAAEAEAEADTRRRNGGGDNDGEHHIEVGKEDGEEGEDDEFGPPPPTTISTFSPVTDHSSSGSARALRPGATEPNMDEIRARREEAAEQARLAQERQRDAVRVERRVEKKLVKEQLEDLAPRAEPGSRERQLEKKREANMSNQAFAQSAHEGGDVELKDSDIMGGEDEDTMSEFKRLKQQEERKKNERELRREEILRARKAEREERGRRLREKEEKTIEYLRSLAKERFG